MDCLYKYPHNIITALTGNGRQCVCFLFRTVKPFQSVVWHRGTVRRDCDDEFECRGSNTDTLVSKVFDLSCIKAKCQDVKCYM